MTIEIVEQEYYDSVVAFAKEKGIFEGEDKNVDYLKNSLDYFKRIIENRPGTRVRLMKDFAPYSFYFVWQRISKDNSYGWETIMNGGVIFHGSHDGGGNGGAPTFSVSLTPVNGWSIHT